MINKLSPHLVAAAIALGLATTAFAAAQDDHPAGPRFGMHEKHRAQGMKGISRLHDSLNLDAKQDGLWKDAEKATKENMIAMRERAKKHHEEMQNLLDQPGADLRAIAKRMDAFRAEGQKMREIHRDRWLAVYDTLDAQQKEKTRLFFKSKIERMARMERRGMPYSDEHKHGRTH